MIDVFYVTDSDSNKTEHQLLIRDHIKVEGYNYNEVLPYELSSYVSVRAVVYCGNDESIMGYLSALFRDSLVIFTDNYINSVSLLSLLESAEVTTGVFTNNMLMCNAYERLDSLVNKHPSKNFVYHKVLDYVKSDPTSKRVAEVRKFQEENLTVDQVLEKLNEH